MSNLRSLSRLMTTAGRRSTNRRSARRRASPKVEWLESRCLLSTVPHGGGGTLFDEHEAVLALVDFDTIHAVAAPVVVNSATGIATTNYFYQAIQGDPVANADGTSTFFWSDVNNWLKETYDPTSQSFVASPADHLPATGDDALIPADVSLTYDLGPGSFVMPTSSASAASGSTAPTITVKDNLRLHSVGVAGSLTFAPNTDLLFYFETMVVEPTGALTITETDSAHTARLVIAAPDWSKFSLAQPFDPILDPFEFSRGLISHGTVNMTGETVTPYVTLPQLSKAANNIIVTPGTPAVAAKAAVPAKGNTPAIPARPAVAAVPAVTAFQFTVPAGTNGWTVGDRIVVTGTNPNMVNPATGASSDEEAVITAATANSDGSTTFTAQVQVAVSQTTVATAPPSALKTLGGLQYDHIPPIDPNTGKPYTNADGSTGAFGVQVSDLSRNIIIQSEDPYHTMARGHTMFMHNDKVNIAGVGFYGLGRSDKRTVVDDPVLYTKDLIDALNQAGATVAGYVPLTYDVIGQMVPGSGLNPRGRYAVHFHRAGIDEVDGTDPNNPILTSATPAEVQDSVVVDSPGWGFVSHTSYVNFDNDVAFNVVGASFVTEAGNEIGRFKGDLAIKGVGANTGEGIESRKVKQDFGFLGDGFWFQGPGVDVENNIAVSQHHDGFVFFTQPLVQNYSWEDPATANSPTPTILSARQGSHITTTILAQVYGYDVIKALGGTASDGTLLPGTGKSLDPGNVPILKFSNNTALADGTGMETWFHQLGLNIDRSLGSQIVGLNVANTRGTAMFDPYTNLLTVKNSILIGNPTSPGGTGMDRNDVTANLTYDNDTIRGFSVGVQIPVNGLDIVNGGTFQNKTNFRITTANSQTRTVMLNDKLSGDGTTVVSPLTFLPLPGTSTAQVAAEAARINVDLVTNYNPKDRDISKMFNPDIIRMGTVWLNSFALGINPGDAPKQLYYYTQAATFVPFPANDEKGNPIIYGAPVLDAYGNVINYTGVEVPDQLFNQSNAVLMSSYGLAIGGAIAPADAVDGMSTYGSTSPRIKGLIGSLSAYQPSLDATSARYTKQVVQIDATTGNAIPQYAFSYRYARSAPATGFANQTIQIGNLVGASGYKPIQLTVNGNVVTYPAPNPTPPVLGAKSGNKTVTQAMVDAYMTSYLNNYYKQVVKLPLHSGWNLVTGTLDDTIDPKTGLPNNRTQLIYGDVAPPDLNLTSPDLYQLRRLSTVTAADGTVTSAWNPGPWDRSEQSMTGIFLGSTSATPVKALVTGQLIGVMNPLDLDFGFDIKGVMVDSSFGHRSFELFITNLKAYLNQDDPSGNAVPFTTDVLSAMTPSPYANVLSYQSFKDPNSPQIALHQHLQTMFFEIKDAAGNIKRFALTIYLDPTAPRTGGDATPSGTTTPSASVLGLATQTNAQNPVIYLIDYDTYLMISNTAPKKKTSTT